ncbi:unnamed protein product [Schistosoma margrebowiei]|uniref:Uncharacterized protein n=1 Tax=Schistosoma margrebowiei TaxID=48269 RepID=A0A3P8BAR3_9TREM|nr:unnamed protein product [Schistosoma margrebowiei]
MSSASISNFRRSKRVDSFVVRLCNFSISERCSAAPCIAALICSKALSASVCFSTSSSPCSTAYCFNCVTRSRASFNLIKPLFSRLTSDCNFCL